MTIEEQRAECSQRTQFRVSAESFLDDGIRFHADDPEYARVCLDRAEELFVEIGDHWNAQIARQWKESLLEMAA